MLLAEPYQTLEKTIPRIDQQICSVLKDLITH